MKFKDILIRHSKQKYPKLLIFIVLLIVLAFILVPIIKKTLIGIWNLPSVANLLKLPIPVYGYKAVYEDSKSYLGANADSVGYKVIEIMAPELEVPEALKILKIIDEGKKVKKGDTLAVLLSFNLNIEKELVSKKIKEIGEELRYLKKNHTETQKEFLSKKDNILQGIKLLNQSLSEKKDILRRMLELYEKRYVSLLDVDNIRSEILRLEDTLSNQQKELQNNLQEILTSEKQYQERSFSLKLEKSTLEKELKKIINILDELHIRSPIDGYISAKFFSEGAEVFSKTNILEVSLYSPLKILAHLSSIYLNKINLGQEVYFRFYESGKEYKGTVSNKYPVVDKRTQTFNIEVLFDNKEGNILPGTTAFVRFSDVNKKLLLIPKFAVAGMPDAPIVFVVKDNVANARKVALGEFFPFGLVEIREGIQEGEIIVKSPLKYINDKTKVRLLAVENRTK